MFGNLPVFRMSMSMARHAAAAQSLAANNAANADTPGFRARRLTDFATLAQSAGRGDAGLRATRTGHFEDRVQSFVDTATEASPNGNSVSLENEMIAGVQASRAHNRALAIYRSHLNILRAAVSRN